MGILNGATSNIDSETEHLIENSIRRLLEGCSAIIIAYQLSPIRSVDRIPGDRGAIPELTGLRCRDVEKMIGGFMASSSAPMPGSAPCTAFAVPILNSELPSTTW